jgi:asparagine synthase (glutamine-hydrolysing)
MNIERKYIKLNHPHNLRRQALYFDQQTYLRSLLYRNDGPNGASIECREPFRPETNNGLGSLDDKWMFTGKREIHTKNCMETDCPKKF